MPFGDYLKHVGPLDVGQLHADMGMPSTPVLCEPVPIPASGVMTCRRGQGQRTFQGQKPPTCDGVLEQKPKVAGMLVSFLSCNKCGLSHATGEKDGTKIYGSLL